MRPLPEFDHVQAGFPAVLVFATLLGVATMMHWHRFHPGHVSFFAWFALYLSTPFLVQAQLLAMGVILTAARRDWAAFDASSWVS